MGLEPRDDPRPLWVWDLSLLFVNRRTTAYRSWFPLFFNFNIPIFQRCCRLRIPLNSAPPPPDATLQAPSDLFFLLQVFGVHLNKWQLDKKLGCGCLFLYGVFLCFSIMTEFNVFTFVNLPMCGD